MIRHIEAKIVSLLQSHHFVEVLFPRLMAHDNWRELVEVLGPLSQELQSEVAVLPSFAGGTHVLCHWQCEPYYWALRDLSESLPDRVFDRSGWSYRDEAGAGHLRPREFIRLEVVWRGSKQAVADTLEALLRNLAALISEIGVATKRVRRDEEIRASSQRDVIDLVAVSNGEDIEVVGAHLHGDGFVRHFWPTAPAGIETACLGVSLTRLARLVEAARSS